MTNKTFATFDPAQLGPLLALKDANTVVYATASSNINRTARATAARRSSISFCAWSSSFVDGLICTGPYQAPPAFTKLTGLTSASEPITRPFTNDRAYAHAFT